MQPKVIDDAELDLAEDELYLELDADEERLANTLSGNNGTPGNLADGGVVGAATLFPTEGGQRVSKGRPSARRAWMFDGTETMLPLAWDTDGKNHDGARRYLLKRHCLCCHTAGFRKTTCPVCVRNNCPKCHGQRDKKVIIPCFYIRKDDVPYPIKFYGDIDCFLPFCVRRGSQGFLTQEDMRIHARSRHRMEYQAHQETLQANKNDEVDELRQQINALIGERLQATNGSNGKRERTPEQVLADKDRMAHVRAGRTSKTD